MSAAAFNAAGTSGESSLWNRLDNHDQPCRPESDWVTTGALETREQSNTLPYLYFFTARYDGPETTSSFYTSGLYAWNLLAKCNASLRHSSAGTSLRPTCFFNG